MKTLGLVGGISWISTQDYYRYLNEGVNTALGGLNFARCIIHSFNYADIKKNNDNNDWDKTKAMLTEACLQMETAGAQGILLCANTMHLVADDIQARLSIPVIHIAVATAAAINQAGVKKVGLLGTRFTMERDFFKNKLAAADIETIIPEEEDSAFIHATIADELGKGIIKEATKQRYLDICNKLIAQGAEGIILGCTEIPLLIKPQDLSVPVFDTTYIHAAAGVQFALGDVE